MKRFLILFLLIATTSFAAPPSRVATYVTGETILSADVTANEDALFNYLQAGVDTYADETIFDEDVDPSANIQSSKLNLQSIAQNVGITSGGSFDNNGATTLDGAVTVTGTTTFAGATISDLGTVTTADINGGNIDGTAIGVSSPTVITATTLTTTTFLIGSANQGDIAYDNGTTFTRLTPGTSGQLLKTQGAGANPAWTSVKTSILTCGGDFTGSATTYFQPGGTSSGTTVAEAEIPFALAGTLRNLYIYKSSGSNNGVVTIYKDGSSTSLTATATGATQNASDTSNTVSVSAGSRISCQIEATGAMEIGASFELVPTQ